MNATMINFPILQHMIFGGAGWKFRGGAGVPYAVLAAPARGFEGFL